MTPLKPPKPPTTALPPALVPRLDSSSLFAGGREVRIVHQGEEYRLRITRQEKLILTK